jgi:hypothetical protein
VLLNDVVESVLIMDGSCREQSCCMSDLTGASESDGSTSTAAHGKSIIAGIAAESKDIEMGAGAKVVHSSAVGISSEDAHHRGRFEDVILQDVSGYALDHGVNTSLLNGGCTQADDPNGSTETNPLLNNGSISGVSSATSHLFPISRRAKSN